MIKVTFYRYCRDPQNTPLFLTRQSQELLPKKCSYCGSRVSCELQILPTLIHSLKLQKTSEVSLDYGNVLIYTCFQSCWDQTDNYRREQVIVEAEEMTTLTASNKQ